METFEIEIQELLSRVVKVKAENLAQAVDRVHEQYQKEKIILDYNDFAELNFIDINAESTSNQINRLILEVINHCYSTEKQHFEESGKPENHIIKNCKS